MLVALLTPIALAASWVRDTVFDTDQYVSTVAPLASDPTIQAAVAQATSNAALDRLAASGTAEKAQDALTAVGVPVEVAQGLLTPVRGQMQQVVTTTVQRAVTSEQFADAWVSSNEQAHAALVATLRGEDIGDLVVIEGATVGIAMGTVVAAIEEQLVEAGVPLADRIPPVAVTLPIIRVDALPTVQRFAQTLDAVGRWLPVAVLILLAVAVVVAPRRPHGLLVLATTALVSLLAVAAALILLRSWIVAGSGGAGSPSGDIVSITLTQLLTPLRAMIRWSALLLALLIALGWLLGDAPAAVRTRSRLAELRSAGWDGVRSRLTPLVKARLSVALATALVATLWNDPTAVVLLLLVVAALVGMVWVELLVGKTNVAPLDQRPDVQK